MEESEIEVYFSGGCLNGTEYSTPSQNNYLTIKSNARSLVRYLHLRAIGPKGQLRSIRHIWPKVGIA